MNKIEIAREVLLSYLSLDAEHQQIVQTCLDQMKDKTDLVAPDILKDCLGLK